MFFSALSYLCEVLPPFCSFASADAALWGVSHNNPSIPMDGVSPHD
jgi:hypothetical protein